MDDTRKKDKVTIRISRPLYNHLKGIKGNLGFNSVTDFVVFLCFTEHCSLVVNLPRKRD